MSLSRTIKISLALFATLLFASCGGSSSSSGVLSLSGIVTTLAGTPATLGYYDGIKDSAGGVMAQFNGPWSVVGVGNYLYITDSYSHTIRRFNLTTRVVDTYAGLGGTSGSTDATGTDARFTTPLGITTDGTNLYVTEANHTIRQIVIATRAVTTLAGSAGNPGAVDDIGSAARFNTPTGITTDGTNLYVTETSHTIRQVIIATGEVTTLAGTAGASGSTDGTGAAARFNTPIGIATDSINLYVADWNNHTIRQIVIATKAVTTLAGLASTGGNVDGIGSAARFFNPAGVVRDGTKLYVADQSNETIRQVVIATGAVTTLAGGGANGSDGTGATAGFRAPQGITVHRSHIYVAEYQGNSIRQIVSDGTTGTVTRIGGIPGSTGYAPSGTTDGMGTDLALFGTAGGLATNGSYLFLADISNNVIRKIAIRGGAVTTLAGNTLGGSANGTGTDAGFSGPFGLAVVGTDLYVADNANHTIRKVDINTGVVTTLAGAAGISGNVDDIGAAARFTQPSDIATDGTNLYVTQLNGTVRQVVIATGAVTTLAGSAGVVGSTDGIGAAASFNTPVGIATDGTNLYVADSNNHTIRQIVIATKEVTTLAGSAGLNGSTDDIGGAARFNNPMGIDTDGSRLFVTEFYNHTVRQIGISSGEVTTLAGLALALGTADGTGAAARFDAPWGVVNDGKALFIAEYNNSLVRRID